MAVTVGVVFFASALKNTVQVFFVPMSESFGISRSQFALAVSAFTVVSGIAAPLAGNVADRIGARRTIAGGVLLAGGTFLGASVAPWFPAFVVLYGVLGAVAFSAMSYVPVGVLVDELFERRRRGLLYAALTNAAALGFVFLSPLWVYLDARASWRVAFGALGVLFLLPLLVAVRWALRRDPAASPTPGSGGATDAAPDPPPLPLGARVRLVLTARPFWALSAGFFACGVTMAFIDVHAVAHLQEAGLSGGVVSGSLAMLGLMEVTGAFAAGWLCDRYDRRAVLAGSYLLRALALVLLVASPTATGALAFGTLFGLTYMGSVIATTLYALDAFGTGTKGLAIGLIWLVHQVGAFLSTQLGAHSFDSLGSYRPLILATAVVATAAGAASVLFLPRHYAAADEVPVPVGA